MTYPAVGLLLGVLGLALAIRRDWLTPAGAGAGLVVGAVLVMGTHAAGPILLVVFLVSSSGLSRTRIDGPRNGWQVLANSAIPGIAAPHSQPARVCQAYPGGPATRYPPHPVLTNHDHIGSLRKASP